MNPNNPHISLNKNHVYTDSDGIIYQSVSSILNKYKEPFDRLSIAEKVAKSKGVSIEKILELWELSALYGTNVHKQLEGFFSNCDYGTDLINNYIHRLQSWKKQEVNFYTEVMLSNRQARIAGMADLIVEKPTGQWSIIDWKTSAKINKVAYGRKKMKGILSHLNDCNFVHYSLQLSMYACLLGRTIDKMTLIHIPRNQLTFNIVHCLDLRNEAEKVIANEIQNNSEP